MYVYSHYVYVIENVHGELYVGLTSNLERRIVQHRKGKTRTTAAMKDQDFHYVHYWKVPSFSWASRFEEWLHRKSNYEIMDVVLDIPNWCNYLKKECSKISVRHYGNWQSSEKRQQ